METYDDLRVAYERAKFLNRIEGAEKYCVTGHADSWAVRLRKDLDPKPMAPELVKLKNWIRQFAYGAPNAVVQR